VSSTAIATWKPGSGLKCRVTRRRLPDGSRHRALRMVNGSPSRTARAMRFAIPPSTGSTKAAGTTSTALRPTRSVESKRRSLAGFA
jgi:hypothetical protein